MYIKTRNKRIATALLALLLLCSCAKQTNREEPSSSPNILLTTEKSAPTPEYTRLELTEEGITVESGAAYYLPLGEGKYVPADDEVWKEYLIGQEFSALGNFSMPFVAVEQGDTALVYVIENPFRSNVRFSLSPDLRLELVAEESSLDPSSENFIRVYKTENSVTAVALAYQSYLMETQDVLTLVEKTEQNPNVAKLFGAPHIYLWGDFLLSEEDVKWQALIKAADSPVFAHISQLLSGGEDGGQFAEIINKLAGGGQDYVDKYQRTVLLRGLSAALVHENFYDSKIFVKGNDTIKALLYKGEAKRNAAENVALNKHALYENLPGVFRPVAGWYDDATVDILNEMKAVGIDAAWIGLNSVQQAIRKPELAEVATANGYLIGPYDSYHSIHEPGKEQWETAKFPDTSLYEYATVQNEQGEKIGGFQKVGRKLNPTLSMPSVNQRVQEIMRTGVQLNSWFVDCDATGEVYDDYSPDHPTTKQQDVAARLQRMEYIARQQNMVVGSEGGNDFAANSIAFAHGIELQTFSWMDEDMKANKDSKYFLGKYYSSTGGVPEKFAKPVPIKEKFRKLFLDMSYQIPLFKLVYHDSVITSYHWDWSTFKIVGESENRMLREILYNVPPMYHLDRAEWDSYKEKISSHHAVWSSFSKKAITQKMTEFEQLTGDRLVQMTRYGNDLQAVANFSQVAFQFEGTAIPPRSVLMIDGGEKLVYTP